MATFASRGLSRMEPWPELFDFHAWRDTRDTLQRYLQIAGKVRLALSPMTNHYWQSALYVTARGITTSPIPYAAGSFEIDFDFLDHELRFTSSWGDERVLALDGRPVAEFYVETLATLRSIGVQVGIWDIPVEVEDRTPFHKDYHHDAYDSEAVERWFRALVSADKVMKEFRSRFTGKCSPVHFWWGGMDLAVTRFSGRRADTSRFSDAVQRESYSEECQSVGFWPGDERSPHAAFYSYAAPEPSKFSELESLPKGAFYSDELHEYLMPYEALRHQEAPNDALLEFFQSTYVAAADLGRWDREMLERPLIQAPPHVVAPLEVEPSPRSGAW